MILKKFFEKLEIQSKKSGVVKKVHDKAQKR